MRLPASLAIFLLTVAGTPTWSKPIMCPTAVVSGCQAFEEPGGHQTKPFPCEKSDCRALPPEDRNGVKVCTFTCRQHFFNE